MAEEKDIDQALREMGLNNGLQDLKQVMRTASYGLVFLLVHVVEEINCENCGHTVIEAPEDPRLKQIEQHLQNQVKSAEHLMDHVKLLNEVNGQTNKVIQAFRKHEQRV